MRAAGWSPVFFEAEIFASPDVPAAPRHFVPGCPIFDRALMQLFETDRLALIREIEKVELN